VVAQEFQWVTGARNRSRIPGVASYDFVKEERRVNAYYFYVHDRQFGAGFIKICSYFPYPAKVCCLWSLPHKHHYASVWIMFRAAGWPVRNRRLGVVCGMTAGA
jgi:hypothetical protein